jgi:hypothetical protein
MKVATNANGVELHKGSWWSIVKPKADGTNTVFHVGKEKYIRKLWNDNFRSARKYVNPFERS